jgi:cytochrome subunit of sulfide dehydrogenase
LNTASADAPAAAAQKNPRRQRCGGPHNRGQFYKETFRMTSTVRSNRILLAALSLVCSAPTAWAQDANLARNLAATCANCHGTNGNARGDMKPLAGVSADKIIAAIADYKSGNQPATIMHQISKGYTDEQIKLVAAFFAAQKPAK